MFSLYPSNDNATLVAHKNNRESAKRKWPFLSAVDFHGIRTEGQLALMVRDRTGVSKDQAVAETHAWMMARNASVGVVLDEQSTNHRTLLTEFSPTKRS